jgi:hypothetical protein
VLDVSHIHVYITQFWPIQVHVTREKILMATPYLICTGLCANFPSRRMEPESILIQESMGCELTITGIVNPLIFAALTCTRMEWG